VFALQTANWRFFFARVLPPVPPVPLGLKLEAASDARKAAHHNPTDAAGEKYKQLFSTFFIFFRHPRVGGDPDGKRSKAITIFT
jgi:hypothetical protein